ncbi:HEAT repeat protein [Granulicella aggregans]|uniref:HEAT repeat protein n=1 Tax=Granulicella aggregans TaxID=474949 RepID=A0A7W8E4E9_9BACT|nr:HEAT repeat protein [Granulicella aggregans]
MKLTHDRFRSIRATRSSFFACLLLITLSASARYLAAQNSPQAAASDVDTPPPTNRPAHDSPSVDIDTAWSMLTSALLDNKHTPLQIQSLAALGTIGFNPRAAQLITESMRDPDLDVRTAAVLAAGQTPALTAKRNFSMELRTLLDDKEPQVAVAAASTLWKMGDHSGEDILVAVAAGERKASAGLMDSTRHTITTDLHNPSTIARIGALQGASMLLGPFGFGVTAYEYIHKNGADTSRTLAIELISQSKTKPIHDELINALTDKDVGVRAAAAKALGEYHDKETAAAIANLFYDSKPPVRLTAAASYLRASGAVASPAAHAAKK